MKSRAIVVLLACSYLLAGCIDEYRGAGLSDDGRAYCGDVKTADTPWAAGCASRHNLAVLAEERDDLILPREEEPRTLTEHDRIWDGYGQSPRPGLRPVQTQAAQTPEPLTITGAAQ
jgi:hypothetical protein